ncbi:unnamed protein product [Porites evermanni]|uniref:Uncharacterized protein n=1 Tax=Porites evermanni TaxID=104178 RepID=A0ABN8MJY8_9CNID|nr:unnamed protein product [Porites evermanni]
MSPVSLNKGDLPSELLFVDITTDDNKKLIGFDRTTNQPTKSSAHHTLLSDIIHDNFLYQLVDDITREHNILDLVLTTNK